VLERKVVGDAARGVAQIDYLLAKAPVAGLGKHKALASGLDALQKFSQVSPAISGVKSH
jgi:hypothetical protein